MRPALAMGLVGILLTPPAHARETTYRLGVPYFMDPGVGGLFPSGQRLGAGAEWNVAGPWSVSLESHWLHQDWGKVRYTLSLTPLLVRHRLAMGSHADAPYLTLGIGGAAMALLGDGDGLRVGLGPAFAAGIALPMGKSLLAQLELQQGAINAIHYMGIGFSLGMRVGTPPATRMITSQPQSHGIGRRATPPPAAPAPLALKPPLPQGQLIKVGQVSQVQGDRVTFAIDDLPYRVQSGDVLVIYYTDRLPIKVAKIRVDSLDPQGRTATGTLIASTEPVKRGYYLGTL